MPSPSNIASLLDILSFCRPAGGSTERAMIRRYIAPLPNVHRDTYGNHHVWIGDDRPILWSCHTDTVHRDNGRQLVDYNTRTGIARLGRKSRGARTANVLGADCGAGVWICLQMIQAGIEGHYVFHAAEECGGLGSTYLTRQYPDWIDCHRAAIAFDRRGTSDVVTHQIGSRCCSDVFAYSLADAIGVVDASLAYKPTTGLFTDTANYVDLIGECTNLSVGYAAEHTSDETLDVRHVVRLAAAMCRLDVSTLVYARKPAELDPADYDDSKWKYPDRLYDCLPIGDDWRRL